MAQKNCRTQFYPIEITRNDKMVVVLHHYVLGWFVTQQKISKHSELGKLQRIRGVTF